MKAECRIRTSVGTGPVLRHWPTSRQVALDLRFPTDSKSLRGFAGRSVPPAFTIGRERAFGEAPANFKVPQPKAARRKL